jgi:hypothetical protein
MRALPILLTVVFLAGLRELEQQQSKAACTEHHRGALRALGPRLV